MNNSLHWCQIQSRGTCYATAYSKDIKWAHGDNKALLRLCARIIHVVSCWPLTPTSLNQKWDDPPTFPIKHDHSKYCFDSMIACHIDIWLSEKTQQREPSYLISGGHCIQLNKFEASLVIGHDSDWSPRLWSDCDVQFHPCQPCLPLQPTEPDLNMKLV